ncbi:hypothetical protein B0H17DRAFT_1206374 [Mycena rosella]|uniref:Uncharacterized protein n=1 Tax=Mycena rosella TaxID=1033263 RepID=A0AAD7D515_MYCRO|nr:hypothetical protein B0H17DRAFT_1206374 [Mycena rosella]
MNHRSRLQNPVPSEYYLARQLLRTISIFFTEPETTNAALISATPGVRFMVARSWARTIAAGGLLDNIGPTTYLICEDTFDFPTNLEEYTDGAGGCATHLCSLFVQHVDFLVAHPSILKTGFHFGAIVHIAIRLRDKAGLFPVVLDCGITRAITTLLGVLMGQVISRDAEDTTDFLLKILISAAEDSRGYKWIAQMLKADSLTSIVLLGGKNRVCSFVEAFLSVHLPQHSPALPASPTLPRSSTTIGAHLGQ